MMQYIGIYWFLCGISWNTVAILFMNSCVGLIGTDRIRSTFTNSVWEGHKTQLLLIVIIKVIAAIRPVNANKNCVIIG